jgi:hypothetical protein
MTRIPNWKAAQQARPGRGRRSVFRPAPFLPSLEALEDRTVPSTFTVTNTNDSGMGSLREALTISKNGDTVQFASTLSGQTIKLTSDELTLDHSLTITGLGSSKLTVDGGGKFRVLDISGSHLKESISGLTFANGLAGPTSPHAGQGGGIRDNSGSVSHGRRAEKRHGPRR